MKPRRGRTGRRHPGERGDLAAPGAGGVDDGGGEEVAAVGADAAHRAVRPAQHRRDRPRRCAARHRPRGRPQQPGRGQHRLHLRVLRVEDAAGEVRGQVGLEVVRVAGARPSIGVDARPRVGRPRSSRSAARPRPARARRPGRPWPRTRAPPRPRLGASSRHSRAESSARSSSGPGSLSETSRLPSPAPVVPPATGPRSTTTTASPARAA